MAASTASAGDGVVVTPKMALSREIEVWDQEKFDLEARNLELDKVAHDRQRIFI